MKQTSLKRILAAIMAGTMLASFAACGEKTDADKTSSAADDKTSSSADANSGDESKDDAKDEFNMDNGVELNEPGKYPIVKEGQDPVTLSVWASPHLDTCTDFTREANQVTGFVEDTLNLRFTWEVVSKGDKQTKLNLIFTSDKYPDIIMGSAWDGASQYAYGKQGNIIALDEYYDGGDAYWFDEYVKTGFEVADGTVTQEILNSMVMPDGHRYSLFNFSPALHARYQNRMWIYEPWLEAVGMEMPTTTEEYYEVLKAFKEKDPNGNGKADEIPLAGSCATSGAGWNSDPTDFIMNSFVYYGGVPQRYSYIDNGKVMFTPVQDNFRKGLEYMAKLDEEGLLLAETWTQDANAVKALSTGDVNMLGSSPGGTQSSFTVAPDRTPGDWTNWKALAPLKGPDGVQYAKYTPGFPSAMFHITDTCKYPKVAFRFGDSMYETLINNTTRLGLEDDGWAYLPEGSDLKGSDGEPAKFIKYSTDSAEEDINFCWGQISVSSQLAGWHTGMAVEVDPTINNETVLYKSGLLYQPYAPEGSVVMPPLVFDDADLSTVIDTKTAIDDYLKIEIATMVTEGVDDAKWDKFNADLKALGYETLIEAYQKSYDVLATNAK